LILINVLKEMASNSTNVTTLVLLGDVFELWLIPFNQSQISSETALTEIKYNHNVTYFLSLFNDITANRVDIVYVIGNHDMEMQQSVVAAYCPNITFIYGNYSYYNVLFEHGHHLDLFNREDPNGLRPFGYYVSRGDATNNLGSNPSNITTTIKACKALPEAVFSDALVPTFKDSPAAFHIVLGLLFDQVDVDIYTEAGTIVVDGSTDYSLKNDTLGNIISQYNNLVGRFSTAGVSNSDLGGLLKGACGDFSYFFDTYFHSWGDGVVLGHTHIPDGQYKTTIYGTSVNDVAYVNSGCWVNAGSMTYVDVDYDYNTTHPTCLSVVEVKDPTLQNIEVIDFVWLYSPNISEISKVTYNSFIGTKYDFRCGPIIECPLSLLQCYSNQVKFNMIILSILVKAGVVEISAIPIDGSVQYGSTFYKVNYGTLYLNNTVLSYSTPNDATSITELAAWVSQQDPNEIIPQITFSSDPCSGVITNSITLALILLCVITILLHL